MSQGNPKIAFRAEPETHKAIMGWDRERRLAVFEKLAEIGLDKAEKILGIKSQKR